MKNIFKVFFCLLLTIDSYAQIPNDYTINGYPVPRHVIESYLSRNLNLQTLIWQGKYHVPDAAPSVTHNVANCMGSDHTQRILSIINNTSPKYISLAEGDWFSDSWTAQNNHWDHVLWTADAIHAIDDEILLEVGLYEHIEISDVVWPMVLGDDPDEEYIFDTWGSDPDWPVGQTSITITADNMAYDEMVWARYHNSVPGNDDLDEFNFYVPDLSKLTTRVYWYWRMCEYVRRGYESFHMGLQNKMLKRDCDNLLIHDLIEKVKAFGAMPNGLGGQNARRGVVFFNAQNGEDHNPDYIPGCLQASGCPDPMNPGTNCTHLDNLIWKNPFDYFQKGQVYYWGDPAEKNILWDWGSAAMGIVESNPPTPDPITGNWPTTLVNNINDIVDVKLMRDDDPVYVAEKHSPNAYGHSIGGIHPQGWKCDHLPYQSVWDNTHGGETPIQYIQWNWTYNLDDKTWFLSLPNQIDRMNFLDYAYSRVKCLDRNAFFVLPGGWKGRYYIDPSTYGAFPNPSIIEYNQTVAPYNYDWFWYCTDPNYNLIPTINNIWDAPWDPAFYHSDRTEQFNSVNKRDGTVYPTFSWSEKTYAGDFNCDGRDDILVTSNNDPGVGVQWHGHKVYQTMPSGDDFEELGPFSIQDPCSPAGTGWPYLSWGEEFYVGDFDGDGFKNDIAVMANEHLGMNCPGIRFYKGNYIVNGLGANEFSGFSYMGLTLTYPSSDDRVYIGDFNGDGKDDILTTSDNTSPINNTTYSVFNVLYNTYSGGTLSFSSPSSFWNCNVGCTAWGEDYYIGDFNGDGKDDFFVVADPNTGTSWQGLELYSSTGTGFNYEGELSCVAGVGCFPSWGERFYIGDFDADGKDDFIVTADMHQGISWMGYRVYMNKTSGGTYTFQDKGLSGQNGLECAFPSWGERFNIADYNGDGYSDFLITADKQVGIDWDGWEMFWSKATLGVWKPGRENTVGVQNFAKGNMQNGITVYPNPVADILSIKVTEQFTENLVIRINSIDGREMQQLTLSGNKEEVINIDMKGLPPGMYLYNITCNEKSFQGKVTKL